jgi:hydroxymethylglutaryl-CoA lyase
MLDGMDVDVSADVARVEAVAREVSDRLGLGATSHVLMGGTVERVLETVSSAATGSREGNMGDMGGEQ